MDRDSDYVEVTSRRLALDSPNFLVEYKGRYYFTVAALEYDPKAKGLTRRQVSDIKKVQKILESTRGKIPAVVILDTRTWKYQSSEPVSPKFVVPKNPPPRPGGGGTGGPGGEE